MGVLAGGRDMGIAERRTRRTVVLHRRDVVDDETLHPGAVVWLGKPRLQPDELRLYGLEPCDPPEGSMPTTQDR